MTKHALDPLGEGEIARAAEIARQHGNLSSAAWFETIALHEPEKAELQQGMPKRRAFVCCYDPAIGQTWDGIANLGTGLLENWRHVVGVQARIVADEFAMGGEIAKADPRVSWRLLRLEASPI